MYLIANSLLADLWTPQTAAPFAQAGLLASVRGFPFHQMGFRRSAGVALKISLPTLENHACLPSP
jgi:hypothetical protein